MHTIRGRIIAVQEQRLRLQAEDGRQLLLTLAHGVPVTIQDLRRLHDAGVHVVIHYAGEANTASASIQAIQWAAERPVGKPAGVTA